MEKSTVSIVKDGTPCRNRVREMEITKVFLLKEQGRSGQTGRTLRSKHHGR